MWTTDFADRGRASALDQQPLYAFPRNEAVFDAVSESHKRVLDIGVEHQVRQLDVPVLVVHGALDTEPARARRVAELARAGRWVELARAGRWVELEHSAHSPWLEEPAALRGALRALIEALAPRPCRDAGPPPKKFAAH